LATTNGASVPDRAPTAFSDRLGFLLAKAKMAIQAVMDAELAPLGITIAQYGMLTILAAKPGLSSAELARECCVSPQSTATLVARLAAEGCLSRRPHPRHGRVIELRVTPKGRGLLARASGTVDRVEHELLLCELSPEEQDHLRELMRRVLNRSRTRGMAPPPSKR